MDRTNINFSRSHREKGDNKSQYCHRKSQQFSVKLISFFSVFLIVLASVFVINISTISTVEAKSNATEQTAKNKKYIKTSRKSRRSKSSRKAKRGNKRYKVRYKKSRRLKRSQRSKRTSRKSRRSKRLHKASYSRSKRYRKSRRKTKHRRRTRARTCDQLSATTLHKKARRYQRTINNAARKYGVSASFVKAIITVETCFRSGLRGTSGEKGLMQLMPSTARRFGVKNRFSTWENIHGGTRYLSYLLKNLGGNKAYAAAGFNGGLGSVSRKTGPKFYAVRNYSRMVMNAYRKFTPRLIRARAKKRKSRGKKKS